MNTINKLWRLTDSDCRIVSHMTPRGAVHERAPKTPVMFWPDGCVCWPVSMWLVNNKKNYLDEKRRKGSRNDSGGTTVTYASLLSSLVRYTFHNRVKDFSALCDDDIKQWVKDLRSEKSLHNDLFERRSDTQIGNIIRKGLHFLLWYQKMMLPHENLIGFDVGNQITIQEKTGKSGNHNFKYITHRHIPVNSSPKVVRAVTHEDITKLYDSLRKVTKNGLKRKRDENVLRMLEASGGRRVEVSELTVDNITKAYKSGLLELDTAKNDVTQPREIPIAVEWLLPVITYIQSFRKKLVRDLIESGKIESDPGFLFLNLNNGKRLSEESITKLISTLRIAAGITHKVCTHMFRHRFITIQVATRLKGFKDKKLPIDVAHTILTKVAVLSGHTKPESLSPYIDLAFEELDIWGSSDKVLAVRSKVEGSYRQIQTLKNELGDSNLTRAGILEKVELLLNDLMSCDD
ncbi:tyrosine-type recombinase/integrase [Shewanella sp. 10N.286.51.B2]|uniref:tyrosine-type recombinase/integrase n=1 Tax=Shewanella sp. 10N.286.51.B2 TaxID=3229707 RepID=UPI003553158A